MLPLKKGFSQNQLTIISVIREDSSFLKVEYSFKKYYLISPERLDIASYKTMQYRNLKEINNELKEKKITDSTIIKDKDRSILLLDKLNVVCESSKSDLQDRIFKVEAKVLKKNTFIAYLITGIVVESVGLYFALKK